MKRDRGPGEKEDHGLRTRDQGPTAILSVYNKEGLQGFALRLKKLRFKILSTGNTAKTLKKAGVEVQEVSAYTGSPEILEGRVKTLHPKIHAGILSRRTAADQKTLKELGAEPIDLVVVNLYPFEQKPSVENIDIGGVTLLRAAAKNFEHVTVICDPADYERVAEALEKGEVPLALRKELAGKVFERVARYDAAIEDYFRSLVRSPWSSFSPSPWSVVRGPLSPLVQSLRYGENPHQRAQFCKTEDSQLLWDRPLQGKELSYTNILDADAAWWLIQEFKKEPFACAILKHANPCGVAASDNSLNDAFKKALACDSQSAFGGIVAFNRELDGAAAGALSKIFLEIILAPGFSKEARHFLAKKKNLRLLETRDVSGPEQLIRGAGGGLLIQEADRNMEGSEQWKTATKRRPSPEETAALEFAWKVVKHVKSNAIVFAAEDCTLGIGAGQMSRIDAIKVATMKLNSRLMTHDSRLVVASDAFFPFPDNIEAIAQAGATAVIQPGGSIKDPEVIAEADRRNLAMVFTGVRHFRH